ncbi:MAG: hypothetical protein HGB11_09420, partial [Chlorobiales bacterium]|nr:hypothetical protein [Chlorobiales bacterium]
MPTPSEHKTVQSRILAYAGAIGWTVVPREEAEERRCGFSLFFDDLLDAKVREFNPRYSEAEGAL